LVEKIANAVQPELDKPFFFFGHSLGAVLAFELARRIRPQPQILFVSACGAPHIQNPNHPIHDLPDSEFIKSLQELNGLPAEVANNAELMELLLPVLRADFEAIEKYQYTSTEHRLECPIIAFGGSEDFHVDRAHLDAWEHHTNNFKSKIFQGDHFFINTARRSVIDSMLTEMRLHHAKN
jgi:medium-chain acyl-[acyl-carrier-protein] hydrolase